MARNIELYYCPVSFYAQKSRMYLCEKGVIPQIHIVSLPKDENLKDEFLKINPKGTVPVLRSGGTIIPDSEEIYRFGEDNIPGDTLVPSHISDDVWQVHDDIHALRVDIISFGCMTLPSLSKDANVPARVVEFMKSHTELYIKALEKKMTSASAEMVGHISAKIDKAKLLRKKIQDETAVNDEIDAADDVLGRCEMQIQKSKGPYLFGETITIADIDLIVLLMRLELLGLDKKLFPADGPRTNLQSFISAMKKRESYQMILRDSKRMNSMGKRPPLFLLVGGAALVAGLAIGIGVLLVKKKSMFV